MGADERTNLKICGEILIDMEKNRKRRTFTFNCAFCNSSCDQLKKFSLHLDQEHFRPILDEKVEMLDADIELEEHLENQATNDSSYDIESAELENDKAYDDPLVTNETVDELLDDVKIEIEVDYSGSECAPNNEMDFEHCINEEDGNEINPVVKEIAVKHDISNEDTEQNDTMNYEYGVIDNEEEDVDEAKETKPTKRNKKVQKNVSYSKIDSDYSADEDDEDDEDDEEVLMPVKKKKKIAIKSKKKNTENSNDASLEEITNNKIKKKRIRKRKSELDKNVDEKEFIKALIEAYEKQPQIWKPKERTVDKIITEKAFETIANEINAKLNTSISWKFAKIRINALRMECSYELEKQRKGEEHQLPWYYEHMTYLQENIDYIIRLRRNKFRSRMKYLDLSLLPILIQLYKTYNDLWQINNINFGIAVKRDEALNKMIEDLKKDHTIDMTKDQLQDYIKYINLLYSKDKEQQLKSDLKNTEFTPSSQFYKDMFFLSDSQGPFKCDTCNELIQKYENYHMHVAKHNNTKPFKCPICETMEFKSYETYLSHARRHLNLPTTDCSICGKAFSYKHELKLHLRLHTGEKPFLCQICGAGFRLHGDYDNHVRRHEKRFRYECHICKHGFNHLHTLKDHVKSHLQIRDIFCDICGKSFTAARYLNNHKLIHEDKKRYKCNVCGKEFSQGASFRTHRKQHQPHLSPAELKRKKESEAEADYLDCFDV